MGISTILDYPFWPWAVLGKGRGGMGLEEAVGVFGDEFAERFFDGAGVAGVD